jgi:hypothetical protein
MSHVRTQIRLAAAELLAGVAPVAVSRVYPLAEDSLPILLVYLGDELIEGHTMGAFRRTADLVVEVRVKGPFMDDEMDTLIAGVERALNRSTLGDVVRPLVPTGIAITLQAGSVEIGTARVTFRAVYHTEYGNPEAAI